MIGERLLDLRKDAGLTQDQLAKILNTNKHCISSYEREKSEPPDAVKIQIAKYFDVSIDYLVGLTNTPSSYKESANFLRLPINFPESAKTSLKDYADFLYSKYMNKENTHKLRMLENESFP